MLNHVWAKISHSTKPEDQRSRAFLALLQKGQVSVCSLVALDGVSIFASVLKPSKVFDCYVFKCPQPELSTSNSNTLCYFLPNAASLEFLLLVHSIPHNWNIKLDVLHDSKSITWIWEIAPNSKHNQILPQQTHLQYVPCLHCAAFMFASRTLETQSWVKIRSKVTLWRGGTSVPFPRHPSWQPWWLLPWKLSCCFRVLLLSAQRTNKRIHHM